MNEPRTCVVIATRNRADLLRRCAEAVMRQEEPPGGFEVLIVDSASNDHTPQTAGELEERFAGKVRAVREEQAGLSRARNRALRETGGEWLAFLDDDAVPRTDWLRKLVAALEAHDAAAAGGCTNSIWPAPRPSWARGVIEPFFEVYRPRGERLDGAERLRFPVNPNPGNMVVRRDALTEFGGFAEHLGRTGDIALTSEDYPFFAWLDARRKKVVFAPDAMIDHDVHAERLNIGWLARRFYGEGVTNARLGFPFPNWLLVVATLLRPWAAMRYGALGRWDRAVYNLLVPVHNLALLVERARLRHRRSKGIETAAPPARKVCAIFPLLPDPSAFLARVRERFPDATINLYTTNPEAAKRAPDCLVDKVYFRPLTAVSPLAPLDAIREGYKTVVVACETAHLKLYGMFLFQAFTWPGVKRFFDIDSRPAGATAGLRLLLRAMFGEIIPRALLGGALHAIWLASVPAALACGWRRGRAKTDAALFWASTRRALRSPLPYLALHPAQDLSCFAAAFQVRADFARGPAKTQGNITRRLLLIRLDHLGDLIATTGVLSALKAGPEPWEIAMIIGPWGAPVLRDDDRIDKLLIYPTRETALARNAKLPTDAAEQRRAVRRWLKAQTFDVVVDPISGVDQTRLAYLPRAARRITTHANRWFLHGVAEVVPFQYEAPETQRLVDLLARAGIQAGGFTPSLRLGESAKQEAAALLEKNGLRDKNFLAVHAGGAWEGRRWPLPCFIDVARRAHERFGFIPAAFFGPDEAAAETTWLAAAMDIGGRAFRGAPLPVVFAIISRAAAFIGNDSGLLHAAAAGGVSSLGVFGPGDLARWTPQGRRAAAVSLHFPCSPCYQSFCTDPRCLLELDVDQVWRAFMALIERGGD
jgi:ADP-heptose:LPS heptosyltransferase/glycosyltransferase involved in cell wall biosynthesis